MDIGFYHVTALAGPMAASAALLEKAYAAGFKVVVYLADAAAVGELDGYLWTYDASAFLPHGSARAPFADLQPIYLSAGEPPPNGARLGLVVNGALPEPLPTLERLLYVFDGKDAAVVTRAREHWKALKAGTGTPRYWQQDEGGRWRDALATRAG